MQLIEPGNLVRLKPGSYLADIVTGKNRAMHLIKNPVLATVLENESNGMNLLHIHGECDNLLYARTDAMEIVGEMTND